MTAVQNAGVVGARAMGLGWDGARISAAEAVASADVVIAGGGVTGTTLALALAQRGIRSALLEARGPEATRFTQLNLAPPAIDVLAHTGATRALASLDPIRVAGDLDVTAKEPVMTSYSGVFEMRPGDVMRGVQSVVDAVKGTDKRTWGRAPIGAFENAAREDLRRGAAAELVQPVFNTRLVSVQDTSSPVRFTVAGEDGVEQALTARLLINATGTKPVPGLANKWHMSEREGYFFGGKFPADAPDGAEFTSYRINDADGRAQLAVALHGDEHTIVWKKVPRFEREFDKDAAAKTVRESARDLSVKGEMDGGAIPLKVGAGKNLVPVEGAVVNVADAARVPYFRTSSGANTGLGADVPATADAVEAIVRRGADQQETLDALAARITRTNDVMFEINEQQLIDDGLQAAID